MSCSSSQPAPSGFRLRELFTYTTFVAIYALTVRWSLVSMYGVVAVAFVGSAMGTVLWRRWSGSRNIFANGLIGGSIGSVVGNWIAMMVGIVNANGVPTNFIDAGLVFSALFSAVTFGLLLGGLFGVLFAFVFEEFCTLRRVIDKRKER